MTYLEKFRKGIELTSKEVSSLYYEDYNDTSIEVYDAMNGEPGRWDYPHTMIFKGQNCNEYYAVTAYIGLTELQMDEFEPQCAERVYPKRVEKTVWVAEPEIVLDDLVYCYGTRTYDNVNDVVVAIHNNCSDYMGCAFCPLDSIKCCSLAAGKLSVTDTLRELSKASVIIKEKQI